MLLSVLGAITLALAWPMITVEPGRPAGRVPATPAVEAQTILDTRFRPTDHEVTVVIEARNGNILQPVVLAELHSAIEAVRVEDGVGPSLLPMAVPGVDTQQLGVISLTDAVDARLVRSGFAGGIYAAPDESVTQAASAIIDTTGPGLWGLATQATSVDGSWTSPALFLTIAADNADSSAGEQADRGAGSLVHQRFARDVLTVLRNGAEEFDAWTVSADGRLAALEQAGRGAPYVTGAVTVILLSLGLTFRSFWPVAFAGLALCVLAVWIEGGARALGFGIDQTLSTILFVVVFAVVAHSAFDALGRLSRSRSTSEPVGSIWVGQRVVFPAAATLAFAAAGASSIESIRQFGLMAAAATVGGFVLLGVATPVLTAVVQGRTGRTTLMSSPARDVLPTSAAAVGAGAVVFVMVGVSPALGAGLLALYGVVGVVMPVLRGSRGEIQSGRRETSGTPAADRWLRPAVLRPRTAVVGAILLAALAAWLATGLTTDFGLARSFDPRSDFVTGLDKAATYGWPVGEEPVSVVVEGPLQDPVALEDIEAFIGEVRRTDQDALVRNADGTLVVQAPLLDLATGTNPGALASSYRHALDAGTPDLSSAEVSEFLWANDQADTFSTFITFELREGNDRQLVETARDELEPLVADLASFLQDMDSQAQTILTGPPIVRDDQARGVEDSLLLTLVAAGLACAVLVAALARSGSATVATTITAVLVVVWLFGLMAVTNQPLDITTPILAALTIGVAAGYTARTALRYLGGGGVAGRSLRPPPDRGQATEVPLGSVAASSGAFLPLAFSPVPTISSFGLLASVTVLLGYLAARFVALPLLALVADRTVRATGSVSENVRPSTPEMVHSQPTRPRIALEIGPGGGWVEAIADIDGVTTRRRGAATQEGIVEAMLAALTAGSAEPPPFPVTITRNAGLLVLVLEHPGGTLTAGVAPLGGPMSRVLETAVLSALGWRTPVAPRPPF